MLLRQVKLGLIIRALLVIGRGAVSVKLVVCLLTMLAVVGSVRRCVGVGGDVANGVGRLVLEEKFLVRLVNGVRVLSFDALQRRGLRVRALGLPIGGRLVERDLGDAGANGGRRWLLLADALGRPAGKTGGVVVGGLLGVVPVVARISPAAAAGCAAEDVLD